MSHNAARGDGLRLDIQGLRAVAVSLVVVYHLTPMHLTGGFVGVDVFFVISGFLITSHLIARPPQVPRDLLVFWGRRIRRLLPASLLVLAVTVVASWAILPDTRWESTAQQAKAAALYVINWRLAGDAVDYLAAESAASPVQHFWSLSVEEQFYLGWPVLILLLGMLALATRRAPKACYALGLGAVVLASFAWSVHQTATNPAAAYFVTPTRIWELGIGGLVAVAASAGLFARLSARLRIALSWAGLLGMLAVGLTYTGQTPFPGWQAALPVAAAALVIMADAPAGFLSPLTILGNRAVQWLGDVSYAVYLWHWPLIVLVPALQNHGRTRIDAIIILALTLVLAAATKVWVEDAFRTPAWNRRLAGTYAFGAAGMGVVLALSTLVIARVHHLEESNQETLAAALAEHDPCLGAGATDPVNRCAPTTAPPIPRPALAAKDKSEAYPEVSGGKDCWSYTPDFPAITCTFGDPDGTVEVALTGNSHAGHWLPALDRIAKQRHWRVTTYLASRCALADVEQTFDTHADAVSCRRWGRETTTRIVASSPDLVVVSNRISVTAWGAPSVVASLPAYEEGYRRHFQKFVTAKLPTVVLRDTPAPTRTGIESIPDCVAEHPEDAKACSAPRSNWLPPDPAIDAVTGLSSPLLSSIDLTDRICEGTVCRGVVGGVVAYFDGSHMTATFNQTLAPYLGPQLREMLR
ncbi:acyltransferase family protein [Nocardioides sp.]|uniref:acyltransferase family protein n=1 Tax=Nocardioides sp. TaxID=35761 RepID=UPI002BAC52A7|nr:acyltransferase family protein [Nocardioides sp.]HSX67385.1 acyltransferase family protein [Nocardioides sp.]